MIRKTTIILTCTFIIILAGRCLAYMQEITLPLAIDYPLLRSMLVSQAFPEAGEKATLVNSGEGCVKLTAAKPQVSENNELIQFEVLINARAGTPIGNKCFAPIEWQGYLVLNQQPKIAPESWQLSFTTNSSEVLRLDRQPAKIAAILWNMIESRVTSHLAGITLDLLPPVREIKGFLLPLFPDERRLQTEKMLASMKPAAINVNHGSLHIAISTEVDAVFDPQKSGENPELNQEELRQAVAIWERWDGLLVYLVTTLSRQMLTEEEKRVLINVLLDTRYRFVNEMADRTIQQDIVRQQFVSVWQVMSPIFKRHLLQDDQISRALGYLAFVSSADALLVFDKLGPTLGLEISTMGLFRLMHMLNADPDFLMYHRGVNPDLLKLFEIEEPQIEKPYFAPPAGDLNKSSLLNLFLIPFSQRTAWAADTQPQFSDISKWKVPQSGVAEYVAKVEKLLHQSTISVIQKGRVPAAKQKMFRLLIPAMAWQESCFRQFVVKEKKLTYLISYNQSSVGLMQVNERVWRGIYNLNRLRWDIHYNAQVGGEIAARYLSKYALKDTKKAASIDDDTLARLIYAMYNGGPSQYKKFFKRAENNKLYDSDKLFWEKFLLVRADKVDQVSVCLVGG